MRKYFLLSAVALLATSTANATTDYAEVTAKATIEVAGSLDCGDTFNFGTIVVKQGNAEAVVTLDGADGSGIGIVDTSSDDVLSVSDYDAADCVNVDNSEHNLQLSSGENKMDVRMRVFNDGFMEGTLTIPANVKAGDYTGSFTVTYTY